MKKVMGKEFMSQRSKKLNLEEENVRKVFPV